MRTAVKLMTVLGGVGGYGISQSLSAELLTDPGFETGITSWLALNSATLTNPAGTRTGGSGTKVLRVAYNAVSNPGAYQAGVNVSGEVYRISGWVQGDGTRIPQLSFPGSGSAIQQFLAANSWQPFDLLYISDFTRSAYFGSAATAAGYAEYDDVGLQKLTLNPQITVPSANMRITQYYTLAASPVVGSQIWVMPRISSFASGNYWLVLLTYNTSNQWDIVLYSVALGVRTGRTSAANIGATNGIRINMNGNLIDLQTTADNGQTWTTRGVQVNNALYNTATDVNTIYSPNNTIGRLFYESAV